MKHNNGSKQEPSGPRLKDPAFQNSHDVIEAELKKFRAEIEIREQRSSIDDPTCRN